MCLKAFSIHIFEMYSNFCNSVHTILYYLVMKAAQAFQHVKDFEKSQNPEPRILTVWVSSSSLLDHKFPEILDYASSIFRIRNQENGYIKICEI